ncbi:MAG: hypothetical protein A3J74_02325 [Elusimicrobia bacterium RIFCSPHIGHO2_02_FULL_57_9]|nr:MAG: hypothetical protein A3J74_02325 [Elusimicrobia bacterium RIFCSPHIGHO2_02_FULL_57_9]
MPRLLLAGLFLACAWRYSSGQSDINYPAALNQQAARRRLWSDPYWRLLLRYRRTWRFALRSETPSAEFFLARDGRNNPEAELKATLEAFFEPGSGDRQAQCRFPARYAWLKSRLSFDTNRLEEKRCPGFESWRQSLEPESATVVFASAYLNSPASMYGHTFLRFDRKNRPENQRLLDHTLNYSAYAPDSNPLLYAFRGLSGGYAGRYSVLPYYVKVQEYTNLESRDLWEYRLALKPDDIELMLRHAWEVGGVYFPYYFFNKNCSYQLLPILDASDPQLRITPSWRAWIIPADTLRWIQAGPAAAGALSFRPSRLKIMQARRAALTRRETRMAETIALGPVEKGLAATGELAPQRQALVLDAASEYILYKIGPHSEPGETVLAREQKILNARTRLSGSPVPVGRQARDIPPHQGHSTARMLPGFGAAQGSFFEELSLRAALHDLIDPPATYEPGSALEMAHLRLRYDNAARRAYLQNLTFIDIFSATPWDPWVRQQSWKFRTGLETADELGQAPWRSLYYGLRAGRGLALDAPLGGRRGIIYSFIEADSGLGPVFRDRFRIGGGVSAGWTLEPVRRWRASFEAFYLKYLGDARANEGLRLIHQLDLSSALAARLSLERRGRRREISGGLAVYF